MSPRDCGLCCAPLPDGTNNDNDDNNNNNDNDNDISNSNSKSGSNNSNNNNSNDSNDDTTEQAGGAGMADGWRGAGSLLGFGAPLRPKISGQNTSDKKK